VKTGKIDLVINTPLGRESFYDEKSIRRAAIRYNIPCITTLAAANARRAWNPRLARAGNGSRRAARLAPRTSRRFRRAGFRRLDRDFFRCFRSSDHALRDDGSVSLPT